jgi:3-hydroxyisobutyrate dehydrogenase
MRVAFLGLGMMGARQAAVLARAGFELTVYNRSASKAEAFVGEHPARAAATPRQAAAGTDAVITMVVDGPQVRELLLGPDGAVAGAPPGTLFCDMSTIAPADARALAAELAGQGHAFIDAPVSGSLPKAETGTLTIMAGGSDADIARARPLLDAMGEVILHVGPVGHGQLVKVLTNAVGAVNCATLAQAMVVGARAGVDVEALLAAMGNSAGASLMVGLKGEPMRTHAYTPWFRLSHMLKDVDFALDEARTAAAPFPLAALAGELYSAAMARGLGDEDYAAVVEVAEAMADTRL